MNQIEEAKNYCASYLSNCLVSEYKLRNKLKEKGYDNKAINEAIITCKEYGYINDDEYAKNYVSNSLKFKEWGYYKIRYKLRKKGISENLIKKYLKNIDFYPKTLKCAKKKYARTTDKAKIIRYLKQKGFDYNNIYKAIDSITE